MSPDSRARSPRQSELLWYVSEGVRIARLDAGAIRRTADDPRSLGYGMMFVTFGVMAAQLGVLGTLPNPAKTTFGIALLQGLLSTPIQLMVGALSIAVVHGAARVVFGATGSYIALLRALSLASIVGCLALIPVLGGPVASIWSLLILLVTFEEIDRIERIPALAVVAAFGLSSLAAAEFVVTAFR